jgi:dienelactone hydrolase
MRIGGSAAPMMAFPAVLLALLLASFTSRAAEEEQAYRLLSPPDGSPHPAVLLVPGCSGFSAVNGVNIYNERADALLAAGYVVVFVDYIGRRYLQNCGHVSRDEVAKDILDAAVWARDQPGVDRDRISAIGWSYGGGGLLAALAAMPPGPPAFSKAVVYYPDCRGAVPWSTDRVATLIMMGELDDVARPALCAPLANRAPPNRIRTILYPDALHAFDVRSLPARAEMPFGTIGYNAEAAMASWTAALDFIR